MPNVTEIAILNGIPSAGTGNVSTIDALMALINEGVATTFPTVANAALSSVPATASSIVLLAQNLGRQGVILTNTDDNPAYIKFGPNASLVSFTAIVAPFNGQWTMPSPIYTGVISVIWSAVASGSVFATELTL